jgi:hypothetical protein
MKDKVKEVLEAMGMCVLEVRSSNELDLEQKKMIAMRSLIIMATKSHGWLLAMMEEGCPASSHHRKAIKNQSRLEEVTALILLDEFFERAKKNGKAPTKSPQAPKKPEASCSCGKDHRSE